MHVLTKIFVVLVSLLAVFLVPLVVVYTHNENSFRARYEQSTAQKSALSAQLNDAKALHTAEANRLRSQIDEMDASKADLAKQAVNTVAQIRELESRLAKATSMQAEGEATMGTLAAANKVSQDVTDGLVTEVRGLRSDVLTLERQKIELDDALRVVNGQLEVAVQARRALQEELQRVKDELAHSTGQLAEAVAMGFDPTNAVNVGALGAGVGVAPTMNLDTTVVGVRRSSDQTLAEVDAGSVDGIRENWVLNIARGGSFKGKLRIIKVDLNRSTGIVTLEDVVRGRTVEVGDTAFARVGEN